MTPGFSPFSTLVGWLAYPAVYTALFVNSEWMRLQSYNKPDRLHWERPYAGQPILLLALYQKGRLRPDTIRLLETAKAAGLYVVAVNTLRLDPVQKIEAVVDCYIERFNFGRDFGSYKAGFAHLVRRGHDKQCPRLLMMNDSVFFTRTRLPKFLADMIGPSPEVLGSTENFEMQHHLGSFCIAMSNRILRHPTFLRYWQRYRLSDIRPTVIHQGEMGLSKALRKCTSAQNEFRAMFSGDRFLQMLHEEDGFLDQVLDGSRSALRTHWKRLSFLSVVENLKERNLVETFDPGATKLNIETNVANVSERVFINCFDDLLGFLRHNLAFEQKIDIKLVRLALIDHLVEVFMSHSQIHQNAIVLLRMGLPIVKLDGIFRGMFNVQDLERICQQIDPDEAAELRRLLLERPDGALTLHGWRHVAFMRGLV